MSTIQTTLHRQATLRAALRSLAHDEASMRDLCHRSGLTRATLREILKTGDVASYVTAVSLEIASGGLIVADECTDQAVKGRALYTRQPAKAVMLEAIRRGSTVRKIVAEQGINPFELWTHMYPRNGQSHDVRIVSAGPSNGTPDPNSYITEALGKNIAGQNKGEAETKSTWNCLG